MSQVTPSVFLPQFSSPAKSATQIALYSNLWMSGWLSEKPKIFILPGRAPEFELSCIQTFFPQSEIFAFDRDEEACSTLKMRKVLVQQGDFQEEDPFPGVEFDFANVDLCSRITEDTKDIVYRMAKRAKISAFFVNYGRERDTKSFESIFHLRRALQKLSPEWKVPRLTGLSDLVKGRVLSLHHAACGFGRSDRILNYRILRVFLYKGSDNRAAMMGVVMTSNGQARSWGKVAVRIKDSDYHYLMEGLV